MKTRCSNTQTAWVIYVLSVVICLYMSETVYGAVLSVERRTAETGVVLRLPILLSVGSGEQVSALQFDVNYPSNNVQISNVFIGSSASSAGKTLQYNSLSNNIIRVIIAGLNQNVIGNGCVAELECRICLSSWNGFADVTLSGIVMSSPTGSRVPAQASNGGIDIVRPAHHTADVNKDWRISLSELLRVVQLYNYGSFGCGCMTEDGYDLSSSVRTCYPHSSDYTPQPDWKVSFYELLRLIQLYNFGSYRVQAGTEDGYGL